MSRWIGPGRRRWRRVAGGGADQALIPPQAGSRWLRELRFPLVHVLDRSRRCLVDGAETRDDGDRFLAAGFRFGHRHGAVAVAGVVGHVESGRRHLLGRCGWHLALGLAQCHARVGDRARHETGVRLQIHRRVMEVADPFAERVRRLPLPLQLTGPRPDLLAHPLHGLGHGLQRFATLDQRVRSRSRQQSSEIPVGHALQLVRRIVLGAVAPVRTAVRPTILHGPIPSPSASPRQDVRASGYVPLPTRSGVPPFPQLAILCGGADAASGAADTAGFAPSGLMPGWGT